MLYVTLGHTDITISRLALGCWSFAGGRYWGEQDRKASIDTVHAALDHGINFFDTAEGYGGGRSEEVLGDSLAGRRSSAVIATKIVDQSLDQNRVAAACEESLRRLKTDYIDLYYIHWPNPAYPLAGTLEAMARLKEQGKVRSIGICNFGMHYLEELRASGLAHLVEVHQLPYNLLWRSIEFGIMQKSGALGIPAVCYSPLAQGLLSGRYRQPGDVPAHMRHTRFYADESGADHGEPGCEAEVFSALTQIAAVCDGLGHGMAEVAIAWLLCRRNVSNVLVGARTPEELDANLRGAETTLPAAAVAELDRITDNLKARIGPNADMWNNESASRFR